jgi:lantibiotic modifying enzyme
VTTLLDAAVEIGRGLCRDAVWHDGRCTWVGPDIEHLPAGRIRLVVRGLGATLYGGTAGVGLFLAHLDRAAPDPETRRTAVGATRHALRAVGGEPLAAGFYEGWAGTAWAALRIAALTDAPELADEAGELAQRIPDTAETGIFDGAAGTLLGLTAMRPVLGGWSGERSAELADQVLARADRSADGASWATGQPGERLGHLLGMSHGASGIALALTEYAAVSGRPEAEEAVRAAFAYERTLFDPVARNWPDLRRLARTGGAGPSFISYWCHGAPGIALARLRAAQRLGDGFLTEAVEGLETTARAVHASLRADGAEFCLCHGLSGNADVLLEGARLFPDACGHLADLALEVAETGIDRYPARGRRWPCGPGDPENPSLMLGLSGVGLFFLRLLDPNVPSVLAVAPAGAANVSAISRGG